MHTHFGMKTCLTIQERGGEGDKQGGAMIEGRAMGGGINFNATLMGRDRIKRENRSNGGQDRMEGNIVSLTQHDCYGSHLQNYTDMAYIELLAFPKGMSGEGGMKRSWNSKF